MDNPSLGPTNFCTQTDALLRKNLAYQKRNKKANCRLISFPFFLCVLLAVINYYARKYFKGKGLNLEPFPPGYVCPAIDMDRDTRCNIPSPPENPPMLQIPLPNDRATRNPLTPVEDLPDESCKKTNSCPATILLTGNNKTLGLDLGGRFFPRSSIFKSPGVVNTLPNGVFGTVSKPAQTIPSDVVLIPTGKRTAMHNGESFSFPHWYKLKEEHVLSGRGSFSTGAEFGAVKSVQSCAVMLTSLVYEKQENLRIMMKMHGLGDGPYWTICYIYFLVISLAYMFCFVLSCSILDIEFFEANYYSLQFVFYCVYLNLQIAFSFLAAGIFSKVKTVIAYAMVFGTGLLGSFYFGKKVDDPTFSRGWIAVMELYPGLALYRMLYEFSEYALQGSDTNAGGMKWKDLNDSTNGMKELLIDNHDCGSGVRKSPLFLLRKFQGQPSSSGKTSLISDGSRYFDQAEKADVAREGFSHSHDVLHREKVEQLLTEPDPNYAIVCDDLKKVYPAVDGNPPKLAVRGLSLALPRGECFGMLGPNGAGKTSFIKMMIGLTAKLWHSICSGLGYEILKAVEQSLKGVNLHSGGVALIRKLENTVGVVYMDEPSTGLDPASRNELWNVVMKAKRDRAILLTTHSMEEAEHLCDRLGIFVNGSLLCVGNAKQGQNETLKARYGGSYMFTITTPSNYEQEVDSMVRRLFPSANKTYHISGTQKFELHMRSELQMCSKQLTMPRTRSRFKHGVLLILLWRMSSSRFHPGSRCSNVA
ncbi:unnamed protein product [Camellia sinensis]